MLLVSNIIPYSNSFNIWFTSAAIFQKLGMNGQQIALVLDKQIDSLPKVSGGEPYL